MTDQLQLALDGVTTWEAQQFECYLARCGMQIHEGSPHVMFCEPVPLIRRMHPRCYLERCQGFDPVRSAILLVCDRTMCAKCHQRLVPEGERRVMTSLIDDGVVKSVHERGCISEFVPQGEAYSVRIVTELKT